MTDSSDHLDVVFANVVLGATNVGIENGDIDNFQKSICCRAIGLVANLPSVRGYRRCLR
ncbi:MAG: hypothetical protein AAFO81_11370 [Pseudomonadota bacterium]